tara:strand:+ start:717 stop:1637 length:921 start_codon:yes stop_codon:yes gene_type:complete
MTDANIFHPYQDETSTKLLGAYCERNLKRTHLGYAGNYSSKSRSEHKGMQLIGVPENFEETMQYTIPDSMQALTGPAILMASTNDRDMLYNVADLTDEVALSYGRRRLSKQTKYKLTEWVYDKCQQYGRNHHEKATLVPNLLGGFNSIGARDAPYEPKWGAIETATYKLGSALDTFRRLTPEVAPFNEPLAEELLRDFGAPTDMLTMQRTAHQISSTFRCLALQHSCTEYLDYMLSIVPTEGNHIDAVDITYDRQGVYIYHLQRLSSLPSHLSTAYKVCKLLDEDAAHDLVPDIIKKMTKIVKSRT